ncbi:MAG TPA: hypothetical protein VJH03_22065 [Blastocatellia bacterium]|nr:hypothetical protein [Blastocatellia bacterium]
MAYVTGMLIDGWFLKSMDLRGVISEDAAHILQGWDEPIDAMWNFPDELPGPLLDIYKDLTVNRRVEDWCRGSAVWQSLNSDEHPVSTTHIFPMGSVASRLAAIFLAAWLRIESKTVAFHDPVSSDETNDPRDLIVQACARTTWRWLLNNPADGGVVALNLTSCTPEIKRSYRWIAALAPDLLRELKLLDWSDAIVDTQQILPAAIEYVFTTTDFLKFYFREIPVDDERTRRRCLDDKTRLDALLQLPANDKLRVVLQAWLEWNEERDDSSIDTTPPYSRETLMSHALVEE